MILRVLEPAFEVSGLLGRSSRDLTLDENASRAVQERFCVSEDPSTGRAMSEDSADW